ncbi:MAG: hypothetical protein JOZ33_03700 [Acidobacteriaceae bacterium]|nr:hypothetical protein [Acidobacteriaceae bacterium]
MEMLDRIRWSCTGNSPEKRSPAEYWELISGEMNVLYVLSFLLTADKEKAERCLEQALDEFIEGTDDFIDWARTRGRDAVLEHAFVTVKPAPLKGEDEMDFSDGLFSSPREHLFGAIAGLPAFERFVFVMTTIYGKSDPECAKFLGAARWKVAVARAVSEQVLTTNLDEAPPSYSQPSARFDGAYLFNPRCSSC